MKRKLRLKNVIKKKNFAFIVTFVLINCFALPASKAQSVSIPHLQKHASATRLVVDGKPFLIRGGELGNSSSSSLEYMSRIWEKLVKMNLNTVLVPFYWELIEPQEGKFDFALVDDLIREARRHNLKIIPLWFASWKNSMSTYVPAWVKTNQKRFPRSQDKAGNSIEILSTFSNGYALNVTYERPPNPVQTNQNLPLPSGGLAIAVGRDEFIFAGTGFVVTFEPNSSGDPVAGFLFVQEGKFENGKWIAGRTLNGDQTDQGRHARIPPGKFGIQRVKLYRYR